MQFLRARGRIAQCRMCLIRQLGQTCWLCPTCSGVYQGDECQRPTEKYISVENLVVFINTIGGFYELWGNNPSHGASYNSLIRVYYYWEVIRDNPEYLSIVKALCPTNGDRDAFHVCLGHRFVVCHRNGCVHHEWRLANRCLEKWNLNKSTADKIGAYLSSSTIFYKVVDEVLRAEWICGQACDNVLLLPT